MLSICPYCQLFQPLNKEAVFCSKYAVTNLITKNNLFYVRDQCVKGNKHTSRYSLRYSFSGYQQYIIDGYYRSLKPRSILFIHEGQEFSTETVPGSTVELMTLSLNGQFIKECLKELNFPPPDEFNGPTRDVTIPEKTNIIENNPGITRLLNGLKYRIWHDRRLDCLEDYLRQIIRSFFASDLESTRDSIRKISALKSSTRNELVRRLSIAKDYLLSHLTNPLDLDSLSLEVGMSKFHLTRSFKELNGISPLKFLNRERIRYAGWLLRHSSLSVAEISSLLCYESPGAFSRAFKKMNSRSPSTVN